MATTATDPQQGDIWMIDFSPGIGDEIEKIRPALVVGNRYVGTLDLRLVVPITGWNSNLETKPWFVKLSPSSRNGLSKESLADTFQLKSVSLRRFKRQLGRADADEMENIRSAVSLCLSPET